MSALLLHLTQYTWFGHFHEMYLYDTDLPWSLKAWLWIFRVVLCLRLNRGFWIVDIGIRLYCQWMIMKEMPTNFDAVLLRRYWIFDMEKCVPEWLFRFYDSGLCSVFTPDRPDHRMFYLSTNLVFIIDLYCRCKLGFSVCGAGSSRHTTVLGY